MKVLSAGWFRLSRTIFWPVAALCRVRLFPLSPTRSNAWCMEIAYWPRATRWRYKRAFDAALATSAIFGFLDHPFSPRYSYGWLDEAQRLQAHAAFLDYIQASAQPAGGVWFVNEDQCLDLVRRRMACALNVEEGLVRLTDPLAGDGPPLAVRWRGKTLSATELGA